jgi:tetratricopeptide (TPR) repeat protein
MNARAYDNLAATKFYSDPPRQAEAKALYEKAIALDSTYVHAWPGLAAIAINEGRLPDAEAVLERVLRIQPGYSDAVFMLGKLLVRMRQPERALPYLVQYAAAYPGEDALYALGMAQMQTGDARTATATYTELLAINPTRVDVMHYLGGALVEQGEGVRAIPLLERAVSGPRGSATDVGLLAVAYAQAGRGDDALAAAEAAAQLAPRDPAVFVLAGRGMLVANRYKDAERFLVEAVRLAPGSAEASTYLSRARSGLR